MGIGAALIMPATLSIITNTFPREERGKAIGIWAGMASIGVGLGPFAGGLLLEYFEWSSVFLLNVPVAAIALLAGFVLVPNSRDPQPGAFDLLGAALSVGALGTLVYGVIEAPERGWTDALVLGSLAAALVLGVAFVAWQRRCQEPMLNLEFFRNPRFSVGSAAMSVAFFSLFGATFAMTQFLQDAMGYSALEAGAAQIPLAFGLLAGAGSGTKLVARVGTTPVVTAGLLGLGTLLGLTVFWSPDMAYLPLGLWFFGLALSLGWIAGPATDSVMGAVPEEKSGVASAMNDVTRQVAGALGTAVIGSLITSLYSSRVSDLPAGASDSIGQANALAATVPADEAARVMDTAAHAFTEAMGIGFLVAGAAAMVAAVVVKRRLPARHRAEPVAVTLEPALTRP
jgi:EmrB/QacA subfamily drug resistance transporter